MNVVRIFGGLGNQMFQYAFGLSLRTSGREVEYDISDYNVKNFHNGFELVELFNLPQNEFKSVQAKMLVDSRFKRFLIKKLGGKFRSVFVQPDAYKFYPEVYKLDGYYLDGYWQNLDYLINLEKELKKTFNFKNKKLPSENYENLLSQIVSSNSVAIHIRGGDYVRNIKTAFYHNVIGADYYLCAIRKILKEVSNPVFFVFTNDSDHAKKLLGDLLGKIKLTIVSDKSYGNGWIDMYLMSKCKYMIIANSSFSWWAAYLNENSGLVILPARWTRFHKTKNLNLTKSSNWIILDS